MQLPIVAWGNGACRADGTWFENFLKELASHGFLVIANGRPGGTDTTDARLHAPIGYFIGGPSDIAYQNAIDDWNRLPAGLPAFMGNLDVGHFGTYSQPNGGEFGRVGAAWLKWQLKGDAAAEAMFVGTGCGLCSGPWQVMRKNLS